MKKIMLFLLIAFAFVLAIKTVHAQSANILAVESISSNCAQVTLNDAAGDNLGPYTISQANIRLSKGELDKVSKEELVAQDDAMIAGATIAIEAINSCLASQQTSTATSTGTSTGT